MKALAKYFKLLGDANRLAILQAIGDQERSVTEIINTTDLSQTLVSFHLRALREAGIVSTRREGPFIYYSVVHSEMMDLLGDFCRLFELENDFTPPVSATGRFKRRQAKRR